METTELQQQLFNRLKETLPPHISLVDELCELLDLSADSVYRRMRGEKPITLDELKIICEHYRLSVDQLLQLKNESVLFHAPGLNETGQSFEDYLDAMLGQFCYFNSFKNKEMKYLSKDIPFWYFYLFPEMAAFKSFFWVKTINNDSSLAGKKFSFAEYPYTECFEKGQQLLKEYNEIPSEELWNLESINSTINQIAYYREAGHFADAEEEEAVINSFQQLLDHLQAQAEQGVKFMPGATDVSHRAPIQFYVNELILGNNTILLQLDSQRLSAVTYSVLSYLVSSDARLAQKTFDTFNVLLSRSSLISNTGEKERNRFFNHMRQKVDGLRRG